MSQAYCNAVTVGEFAEILDPGVYQPLPDDWLIGATDVVGSTAAIAAGAYKSVNMAGAAVIAAIANAIGHRDFPFVFGGDGASFAIAAADRSTAEPAIAQTMAWASDALGLTLRGALIPIADIRAAGVDVRIARYAVSNAAGYTMFAGGGLRWAEQALKAGRYAITPDPSTPPELAGLSCRWSAIPARRGLILSLIVEPASGAPDRAFTALAAQLLAIFDQDPRHGHPVPEEGPGFTWPPPGFDLEVKASRGSPTLARLRVGATTFLAFLFDKLTRNLLHADPGQYRHYVSANTDYRKYDDALRLTVDCTEAQFAAAEALLAQAAAAGVAHYGLHKQSEALMTCFVPSVTEHSHLHFLDGAGGGYALAARALKESQRQIA